LHLSIPATSTATLTTTAVKNRVSTLGVWDLELVDGTRVERIHEGTVTLSLEVTK
jgi:hypothetical protein